MTGICLPIDASAGSPSFPAAQHRVAQTPLMGPASGRPLGARSGLRPGGEPTVTVTGSTWTVTPFSCIVDPGTGQAVGPYLCAFLANETGSVGAADQNNQRIDRLDVQVPDDPAGASPLAAVIVKTAGTAGQPAPSAPARSTPLGTITVPKVGGGSPVFTPTWQYAVAAGASIPVNSQTERDALPTYRGLSVVRLDANGVTETYSGTAWTRQPTITPIGSMSSGYTSQPKITWSIYGAFSTDSNGDTAIMASGTFNGIFGGIIQGAGGTPYNVNTHLRIQGGGLVARVWNGQSIAASTGVTLSGVIYGW